jgi:hypothetical protein
MTVREVIYDAKFDTRIKGCRSSPYEPNAHADTMSRASSWTSRLTRQPVQARISAEKGDNKTRPPRARGAASSARLGRSGLRGRGSSSNETDNSAANPKEIRQRVQYRKSRPRVQSGEGGQSLQVEGRTALRFHRAVQGSLCTSVGAGALESRAHSHLKREQPEQEA